MATPELSREPLNLQLFKADDDAEDLLYKNRLHDLVIGTTSPAKVAEEWTTLLAKENYEQLATYIARPNPRGLSDEEETQGISLRTIAPNPSGAISETFRTLTHLMSAFPPFHEGQNRIIDFMTALRDLRGHTLLDGVTSASGDEDAYGNVVEQDNLIQLWEFGGNWQGLCELFVRQKQEYSYPFSDIERPGSETAVRWRNWQSALARITTLGLLDCGFLSALDDILPPSRDYPDMQQRKIGGPNRLAGSYVYKMCKKTETVNEPREMWSMERWNTWKEQYIMIAKDDKFYHEARVVAKLAVQQMESFEKEDTGTVN
ncbi:hypothetical protein BT63DRAFT_458128 [Microthyrium microscopicum]|uniref:Uncharacterized protein n=1 Tax=Microthyrium microscopicum TaxID=703497 RepID=A0A6A6U8B6_9PEZI|nr:hypothetical protein BT63DRAFT_458128 [Microthyrium microscopicum]